MECYLGKSPFQRPCTCDSPRFEAALEKMLEAQWKVLETSQKAQQQAVVVVVVDDDSVAVGSMWVPPGGQAREKDEHLHRLVPDLVSVLGLDGRLLLKHLALGIAPVLCLYP